MSEPLLSFVSHGGHSLAILSHSNAEATRPPVVWIHGLTASLRFWEAAMYEEIRASRSWYSISLPLHYPSTYAGDISVDALSETLFAELVREAVDSVLPAGKFHLAGYSLGAFACLNYAAKHPGRVLSVISIGGFMTGRAKGLEGVLQFFSTGNLFRKALFHLAWWVMQQHIVFLKLATVFYARRWRQLFAYPELDPTLEHIFPDVSRHSIHGQRVLFRYLLNMDLMDEVAGITIPVLAIAGTRDPIIPFAHQRAYAERLPNGELLALDGVGHVSFAEAPDAFRGALLGWLARHDEGVTES
ncbi:pimeloyl-ACP methyl ester carboxylesterase [Neolewinella xylanilytica]|uniref:Pimeloyl-ACP methyl ester carboxylesterase n=1 Tax=Neolewinella xylanilytica TaxID=1514080 RepID=A0A2S6I9Z3_9BACT|nr:alpha/beta hydrolase [Neolewinella xylanilytica]PPK88308.1 pimeloyl-ACP methyl ester carboxylesterase [Neolewinella xylanilytica]